LTGRARFAVVAAALVAAVVSPAATAQEGLPRLSHAGIELIAAEPREGAKYDIPLLDPRKGLEALRGAVDLLVRRSPLSAGALDTLKRHGRVVIVYDPHFPERKLTEDTIAAFFPNYFRKGSGDFLVRVGRYGIGWPADELAAVLAHELVGHGMQHLRGDRETMRPLDRECEASLYEEKAYQDLGVDKSSVFLVQFRATLENRHCADFRWYQRRRRPDTVTLWDARNPDVVRLLAVFKDYLKEVREHGVPPAAIAED
jgi:hypothetical protein